MNDLHALTAENMLRALPRVLQEDPDMYALAASMAEVLNARQSENESLSIYPNISTLPEELLDILAYDFKVDWWNGDYSVEEKRRTLEDSWRVHRMLGTKAAVKAAISAIYPETEVEEWFEYGGKPYFFKLLIDLTGVRANPEAHERILDRIRYYKNLRSHIEEIQYVIHAQSDVILHMGGCMASIVNIPITEIADTFRFEDTAHVGGRVAAQHTWPIPEWSDALHFENAVHAGGRGAVQHRWPIPEISDTLEFKSSVHAGGRAMTYTFLPVPEIKS